MNLEEFYAATGGNYADTKRRLMNDAIVKKFVLRYREDPTCAELEAAIEAKDWETAFRGAHTLKGLSQNLGFDRLFETSFALTEALRGPKPLEDASLWPPVVAAHEEVLAAIREL